MYERIYDYLIYIIFIQLFNIKNKLEKINKLIHDYAINYISAAYI